MAHWAFISAIKQRFPASSSRELANRVKDAAGKNLPQMAELRDFSHVSAWRARFKIQELVAAIEAKKPEIPEHDDLPEAEHTLPTATKVEQVSLDIPDSNCPF